MTDLHRLSSTLLGLLLALAMAVPAAAQPTRRAAPRGGDHIVAVVNNELVTANEVEQRLARAREEARRSGQRLPSDDELRQQVLDSLIDERVQVTYARDAGSKVDEAELDRAVAGVASQNQLSVAQLRQRLTSEGMDYTRFRNNLRDQLLIERVRERELQARVRISDADVEAFIVRQRGDTAVDEELNIAQILVPVPEGANVTQQADRRARAEQALGRVRSGEDFAKVAAGVSEDGNKAQGGEIGLRPASRLPDLFVTTVRGLQPGQVYPEVVRSGAGWHVLKLVERREASAVKVTQTRARHILLRVSPTATAEAQARKLDGLRRQIASGPRKFEDVAREVSEDASAPKGGDLGWVSPGGFVPEFEEAMDRLGPDALSGPVVSRFGVHLIQVMERRESTLDGKEVRDRARVALREQKYEQAYLDWARELRNRAYVELREPPQ